jgi:DNA-binding MarR family transcriptional regulator
MSGKRAPLDLNGTGYCASFNFRRTARAVTRMYDDALQESGMRSTQWAILVSIAKSQPVAIGAVSDVLVVDRTTLTRSLRLLEREGLLTISKRSTMRQRFLSLTEKGEDALRRSLPAWRKAHQRFVDTVGSQYWIDLRNELETLSGVVMDLEESKRSVASPLEA